MSTRSAAAATDPAIARFIEEVTTGSNAAADSVAGLILRLVGRVARLEQTLSEQEDKIARLAKPPAASSRIETGIDVRDGSPVRLDPVVEKAGGYRRRGRPPGSRDTAPRHRRRRSVIAAPHAHIVDPDWDRMG